MQNYYPGLVPCNRFVVLIQMSLLPMAVFLNNTMPWKVNQNILQKNFQFLMVMVKMNILFEQPEYKVMMFYEDIARIFWDVTTTALFFQGF